MHRRWFISRTNPEYISFLSRTASVSPVFAQVLISRGLKSSSDIQDFLSPGLTGLSDPFDLSGITEALARLKAAGKHGEKVLVHGDYDADGLTATAIMVSALSTAGIDAAYFIPDRLGHGYGFNSAGVEAAVKAGARLIITVDCGIGSFEAVALARGRGIDVIITDHHEPIRVDDPGPENLESEGIHKFSTPEAIAVINPKLNLRNSALHILSGAGIALKFAQAMTLDKDISFSDDDLLPLFDLAALGTIADVVPLTGENRIIVKEAMLLIHGGSRPGLMALRQAAGLEGKHLKAGTLSYSLVPRINAAGRMGEAGDVVRLFLSDSAQETADLAAWLDRLNSERQKVEEAVFQAAFSKIAGSVPDSVIMLAGQGWHPGVLGIVASRVAELFRLPAIIFSVEDGIAKGSARSISTFDICKGLDECKDLLVAFGGHKQAAGVKLREAMLPAFEEKLRQIIRRDVSSDDLIPTLRINAPASLSDLTPGLMSEFELLEPFGYGNPEPLLGARELEVIGPKVVGVKHLKLRLKKGPFSFDAIGFDMGGLVEDMVRTTEYDAAFSPAYNEWNGSRNIQLVLKGIRPSR
jgi:single-stranded-DNA-specific exonuclease